MIEVEGLLLVVGKVYGTVEGMLLRILAGMKKVDGVQYGVGGWWWWTLNSGPPVPHRISSIFVILPFRYNRNIHPFIHL